MMKISIELEDVEALEYASMLSAVGVHFEQHGNLNHLLAGAIEAFRDKISGAMVEQVPPSRINEILNRKGK